MKIACLLIALLLLLAVIIPTFIHYQSTVKPKEDFFFGVSFGQETVAEAKQLIDKVKDYTNFFLINNYDIITNETALTEVTDYAIKADLDVMLFLVAIRPLGIEWLENAKEKYGDRFLGVYLHDEPGGRQIDTGAWFSQLGSEAHPEYTLNYTNLLANASTYTKARQIYTESLSEFFMDRLKERNITIYTSDYALYWFDYQSGYDTVFAQLGWEHHDSTRDIALCRGAANAQDKDWGAIITWKNQQPPYLGSGPEILKEMKTAYLAGAKYVVLFNYAEDAQTGRPIDTLLNEHYIAMKDFWMYTHRYSELHGTVDAQAAFILPQDYGWGMRHAQDSIWGIWSPDEKSPLIWEKLTELIKTYDLKIDIVYEDERLNYKERYPKVYYWNTTVT